MKKFMVSIAAICLTLFFVSCGGESKSATKVDSDVDTAGDTDSEDNSDSAADTDSADPTEDPTEEPTDSTDPTEDPTEEPTDPTEEPTEPTEEPTDPTDSDNPLYAKFIGRWAAKIILHSDSVAVGIDAPSITTRYVLVEFSVNDKGQLDMNKVDNKLCRTDNRTGKKGSTAAGNVLFNEPDYKFNTIFHHWKPADIAGQEDVPYVEVAQNGEEITFKLNKDYELRGANMENPATEEMISKKNDSRIFDHDNDGEKAFTIGFKGSALTSGDMYYVQRLWHIFEGKMVADDKIEGNVDWFDEQFIVASTNATLGASKQTTTLKDKSIFQFVKVDSGMDCNSLLDQLDAVFDIADPNADDAYGRN